MRFLSPSVHAGGFSRFGTVRSYMNGPAVTMPHLGHSETGDPGGCPVDLVWYPTVSIGVGGNSHLQSS